ncbi:MFS transporter [Halovenus sp. WSH3]|uniref:MFS transporter n=2 Tax=Halovenus carboxidivorans TaxID=2692199 RepID=A0A6B0TH52_9EURY|nr:MFS transporter [Halovenus carboxidivorans]
MTQSVSWRSYALVVLGTLVYTSLMFSWFSLPAYLPTIIDDVGLSSTEAGILAGAVPLTYIPLALFSGLAVDRFGPGHSLGVALGCIGVAQIARSAAPGFLGLLATTIGLGVGATLVTFGLPKLVSVLFPPDETGLPSSIYLVGASAGTATAFSLGRPLIGPALGGWRRLFFWSGVLILGYAVVWLAVVRLSRLRTASGEGDGSGDNPALRDLKTVLLHRELRLVVVLGITYLLIIHGLQGWLPAILESRGLSAERAGQTTTLLVGANVLGVLTIPGLADRFGARRAAIVATSAVAGLGVAAIIGGGRSLVAVAGIVGAGLGVGGLSPMVRAIPPALDGIGARLTGTAVGLVFAVGEIGGFAGPFLIGFLRESTGSFTPGLAVLAVSGIAAVVAGFRLDSAGG